MSTFLIYQHPAQTQQVEVIKSGFAWPAFFFTIIWALSKKMWARGGGFLGLALCLVFLQMKFGEFNIQGGVILMLLLLLCINVFFGLKGNGWRKNVLERRGFKRIKVLNADSPANAVAALSGQR